MCHQSFSIKLEHYGVRGVAYNLIHFYLSDEKQFVAISQNCSTMDKIQTGAPQDSSSGPLFILNYINDLNMAVNCNFTLFADNTCFIIRAPSVVTLQKEIKNHLGKLHERCCVNKLTNSTFKTNALIFPTKLKRTSNI